jgi:hypothetical protein
MTVRPEILMRRSGVFSVWAARGEMFCIMSVISGGKVLCAPDVYNGVSRTPCQSIPPTENDMFHREACFEWQSKVDATRRARIRHPCGLKYYIPKDIENNCEALRAGIR